MSAQGTPGVTLADRMVIALEHEARAKDARIDALEARERELESQVDGLVVTLERTTTSLRRLHDYLREHGTVRDTYDMLVESHNILAPASAEVEG